MRSITLAAAGDIFMGEKADSQPSILSSLDRLKSHLGDATLLVGNLEGPFTSSGHPQQGKCTLKSDPAWAEQLRISGFRVMSLANNHTMDFGVEGLLCTMDTLRKSGIGFVGAGKNMEEACRPLFLECGEQKLAFLARTSVIVTSPSYASRTMPGVAFLDISDTKTAIKECRKQADIVILMLHWGIEHYSFPSPEQRKLAQELINAGTDLILGHHPHVLQGIERFNKGLVCYSLGNFIFKDFQWSFIDGGGQRRERRIALSQAHRQSGLLTINIAGKNIGEYNFLPTYINADGTVSLDDTDARKHSFYGLSIKLMKPWYQYFWWSYSVNREWALRMKPLFRGTLSWSKLMKLRPKHIRQLLKTLQRSVKITTEKSTNPYD
jgi:poly-gamma-glutamate capsule biosynthesis protein CapA/YwtB (metallophosphatase superfamily)